MQMIRLDTERLAALIEGALEYVRQAASIGRVGVCFSGGKDSTVLLHLVRSVIPDAPAGFWDSGAEYKDTLEFVAATPGVEVIKAEPDLLELCRRAGKWGYPQPNPEPVQFDRHLIYEPSQKFVRKHNLDVLAIGLRAEESAARRMNAARRGLYYCKDDGIWHLCPLYNWTVDDVWAYIARHGLAYNRAYDKLAAAGVPRKHMRVSCALGAAAASRGRYVFLRLVDMDLWNRLRREFPKVTAYT
jgi:phosphoadenosine phosphosulfate reductase